MAWGLFKKIKNAFKKATDWVKDKVIKPVVNTAKKIIESPFTKKAIDTGVKLAPMLGAAIGQSKGNAQAGLTIGNTVQNIGNSLGFGK